MAFSLGTILTNTYLSTDSHLLFRKMLAFFHEIYTQGKPRKAGKSKWYSILKTSRVTLFYFTGPLESPVPHVPDVSTFDGIHDLFSLCNIVEMANIVHPDTYSDEGLPASERLEMIRGRSLSRAIVSWVISNYETEEVSMESFYWKYLAYQARAVCCAKKFGDANGAYTLSGIPLGRQVQELTERSFRGVDRFWAEWDSLEGFEPETFAWPETDPVVVKTRDTKLQGTCLATLEDKSTPC
jgi:hypothetical protein